jgi:hypothetical protein
MKYFSVDFESVDSRLLFSIRLIDLILAITYIEKLLCKLILKHDLGGLRQGFYIEEEISFNYTLPFLNRVFLRKLVQSKRYIDAWGTANEQHSLPNC